MEKSDSQSSKAATDGGWGVKKQYYSDADDAVLRQFVSSHPELKAGGKRIWRIAQMATLLPYRSWSSMMGRWKVISKKSEEESEEDGGSEDGGDGDGDGDGEGDGDGGQTVVSHPVTAVDSEREAALKEVVQLVQSTLVDQQIEEDTILFALQSFKGNVAKMMAFLMNLSDESPWDHTLPQ